MFAIEGVNLNVPMPVVSGALSWKFSTLLSPGVHSGGKSAVLRASVIISGAARLKSGVPNKLTNPAFGCSATRSSGGVPSGEGTTACKLKGDSCMLAA